MRECGIGSLPDVLLNDVPLVVRGPDLLARRADRQHPLEGLHIVEGPLKPTNVHLQQSQQHRRNESDDAACQNVFGVEVGDFRMKRIVDDGVEVEEKNNEGERKNKPEERTDARRHSR